MAQYQMEMILEYAKVFPENADMGNPDGPTAAKNVHKKGGQYIVNAYFTDQEQIDFLVSKGLQLQPMNSPRIIEGNAEYGIGKYMKLRRYIPDDIRTFTQRNGEEIELNFGGSVNVVDATDMDNPKLWNLEEQGYLGNGTKAYVDFEVYSDGAGVRLVGVAVTEHVPYESGGSDNPYQNADVFKVA
jgi:hypothetical protein